jgi:hypothetical protein
MATQLSVEARNARLNAIETTVGTAPKLQIRTEAPPENTAAADVGTLLVEKDLPSDWMDAAASGEKPKLGTWQGTATGTGTAGHYRIKNTAGSTTHVQGTVSMSGGGGDMILDNTSIAPDQTVTITAYKWTDANA